MDEVIVELIQGFSNLYRNFQPVRPRRGNKNTFTINIVVFSLSICIGISSCILLGRHRSDTHSYDFVKLFSQTRSHYKEQLSLASLHIVLLTNVFLLRIIRV